MRSTLKIGLFIYAMTAAAADAAELGRLFFTPEQRSQLDYSYSHATATGNSSNALMLNGIVQKHGGKRTVWINGVPQTAGRGDDKSPDSVAVPLPGQNKSVKLKVGQRVLLAPSANQDTTQPDTSDH
jgi:hypothetical protein